MVVSMKLGCSLYVQTFGESDPRKVNTMCLLFKMHTSTYFTKGLLPLIIAVMFNQSQAGSRFVCD
jgi:hypothetical protein